MSNPMNHLDRALDRSRRRAEEAKKTERPPLDPKRFEADEYLTDGTVKPKTQPKQSPLGLRPRHIADEARLSEIDQAIARFAAEGAAIPSEWEAERLELIQRDKPRVAIDGHPVHSAMEVLKAAMKADPEFARTWHDNLAMAVMDSESRDSLQSDHEVANDAAARFMKSAFDVDTMAGRHSCAPASSTACDDQWRDWMAWSQRPPSLPFTPDPKLPVWVVRARVRDFPRSQDKGTYLEHRGSWAPVLYTEQGPVHWEFENYELDIVAYFQQATCPVIKHECIINVSKWNSGKPAAALL